METEWRDVEMFCPNCGTKIKGSRRVDRAFKVDCPRCRVKIFSKQKSRKEINIKVTNV